MVEMKFHPSISILPWHLYLIRIIFLHDILLLLALLKNLDFPVIMVDLTNASFEALDCGIMTLMHRRRGIFFEPCGLLVIMKAIIKSPKLSFPKFRLYSRIPDPLGPGCYKHSRVTTENRVNDGRIDWLSAMESFV